MPTTQIAIRPLAASELARLIDAPWPGGRHARHQVRFARQQRGDVLYLIGWQGTVPVGHLLLVWAGPEYEPLASAITDCAEIQDFVVRPDLRSQGIGRRMLAVAEDLARRHGSRWLGLYVGLDNPRARALYERNGFVDSGFGELPLRWQYQGEDGKPHWHEETAVYLIKELA
jgi:GNAT superfamily N-acetyltransferase